jgi:hypothetical protein
MELMLFIGNDCIASVPVSKERLAIPGYLGTIKRNLLVEHSTLVEMSEEKPEFVLAEISPTKK